MLDKKLVAAALVETSDELQISDQGEAQAFARAVASSLQLEGIAATPEQVLEAGKATQKP